VKVKHIFVWSGLNFADQVEAKVDRRGPSPFQKPHYARDYWIEYSVQDFEVKRKSPETSAKIAQSSESLFELSAATVPSEVYRALDGKKKLF
jgi:hypothetical protein